MHRTRRRRRLRQRRTQQAILFLRHLLRLVNRSQWLHYQHYLYRLLHNRHQYPHHYLRLQQQQTFRQLDFLVTWEKKEFFVLLFFFFLSIMYSFIHSSFFLSFFLLSVCVDVFVSILYKRQLLINGWLYIEWPFANLLHRTMSLQIQHSSLFSKR